MQVFHKKTEAPYIQIILFIDQKRKESPYMVKPHNNDQIRYAETYMGNRLQLQSHQLLITKVIASFSYQCGISTKTPMTYNITASMDRLSRTNCVDFGKCQYWFGRFLCPTMTRNKVSNKGDKRFSPDLEHNNGRARYQPVCANGESGGTCGRKL